MQPADTRRLLQSAGEALVDDRRQLDASERAALALLPDRSIPSLAALAHEVRLAWCGD